jgi:hypothetical protein
VSGHRRGLEPYTGRELTAWVERTYRPVRLPQSDHMWVAFELPTGSTAIVPGPSAAKHQVASGTARKVATDLGMTYEEMREAMGRPLVRHGRPGRKPVRTKAQGCTKGEVIRAAHDLRSALADLESSLRGDRDPSVYLRLHELLSAALVETNRAVTEATKKGAA